MTNRFSLATCLSVLGVASTLWMSSPLALLAQPIERSPESLFTDLQLALCLDDFDTAIALTGALMAHPDVTSAYRADLVALRHQLQTYEQRQVSLAQLPGCPALLSRYVAAVPTHSPPLNLPPTGADERVATTPDQLARQLAAAERAGLMAMQTTPVPPLSPALLIQTPAGSGVSAGAVARNVDVFSFFGREGDPVTLTVDVTRVLPGALYTDDDSQIFVFDSAGTLLAENDDLSRLQSQITDFMLPATDIYYVAITTYNNDPILNGDRQITDWTGNGGSAIEYTITVRGVTPSEQFIQPVEP
jgi:hypothetical protein